MKKISVFLALFVALTLVLSVVTSAESYEGTAQGYGGDVTVLLTVENGVIKSISAAGDNETPGIGSMALELLPPMIVENNSLDIDGISGATLTSQALLAAANDALEKAGLKAEDLVPNTPQEKAANNQALAFEDPDVIIVGAGFAGVNAAIAASDAGAKVYLIEQNAAIGGSIRYAGGTISAAGAQMQKDAGVEDSPENFAQDIVRMGGGTNIKELTEAHTNHAAAAVDFLDSIGVDFGDRQPQMSASYDAFNVPREYRAQGGGVKLIEAVTPLLQERIDGEQVILMLDTRVADIIVEDDTVKGVILDDAEHTEYRASATILATGGYGHNEDLIHRYNFANVLTMSPSFCTGDGFIFAEKAGAEFSNMDYLPAYPGGVPVGGFDVSCTAVVTGFPGVIWVDQEGKRIVNEFDGLDSERKSAYANAPENLVFMILTEEMKVLAETPLLKVGGGFSGKPDEGWQYFDSLIPEGNTVFAASTLAEVAKQAGVDSEGLLATINAYNEAVTIGEDIEFGRPASSMMSFQGDKYYIVKTCPYVMLTKGGPVMNTQAQTLNAQSEPIPGLYQCGELVGGGNIGGSANIGGLANTICVVWGRIAGENAAAFALAQK